MSLTSNLTGQSFIVETECVCFLNTDFFLTLQRNILCMTCLPEDDLVEKNICDYPKTAYNYVSSLSIKSNCSIYREIIGQFSSS